MRRLKISKSGWWYLALTIAIGVVAITTGNNTIYLIESLLLSGVILSGVLSEKTVSSIRIEFIRSPAIASSKSQDRVRVMNTSRFPLFCIEVGEWKSGRVVPVAFIPKIDPRQVLFVHSQQVFQKRGVHSWDGLAVATHFPYGFARKIRIDRRPGSRMVWPESGDHASRKRANNPNQGPQFGLETVEGEARPLGPDDDCRSIVWTLSARGMDPMVRVRRSQDEEPKVVLDLRTQGGPQFESNIKSAALPFHRQERDSLTGTLTIMSSQGRRQFHGKKAALDQLATARAELEAA